MEETFEQFHYRIGKEYKEHKKANRESGAKGFRSSWEMGEKYNMDHSTIERLERFTDGIDAIMEVHPELAESILTGKTKVSQRMIVSIGRADFVDQAEMIRHLYEGRFAENMVTKKDAKTALKNMNAIAFAVAGITGETGRAEYTVENLLRDISFNSDAFIKSLERTLKGNKGICKSHKREIIDALNKHIVKEIEKFEEEILLL